MTPASIPRERYKQLSLSELEDLAAEGPESFTPEAWQALSEEIEMRASSPLPETAAIPMQAVGLDSPSAESLNPFVRDGVWLTLFQGLIAIRTIMIGIAVSLALPAGASFPGMFGALTVVLNVFGLVLIAQRRPLARRFWVAYLGVSAVLSIGWSIDQGDFALSAVIQCAGSLAWAIYWVRSERVRLLFGDLDDGHENGRPE